MRIKTGKYVEQDKNLPNEGQHILCYQEDEQLVVYQAYNPSIADYAIKNQCFGGAHFSYNRMSWIKPNFLWMMYRCGWATKENQQRVLAIWINKIDLENILRNTVFTSFTHEHYGSHEEWKEKLEKKEARLQWDPDHDPFGESLTRRAIQIGMKGKVLEEFGKQQIQLIEDITDFVKEQKLNVDSNKLDRLLVPIETVYKLNDEGLRKQIGTN